ncbi:protein kinase IKS1 [Sporobolomyces koalae]|uniref:protein kinase IKS1 n=1 Tax=Sporobolomyces koalae TaxID=500713 RepID=UPI003171208C
MSSIDDVSTHPDWQVVLVQPSQRKVVLFNPRLNALQVSSPDRSNSPASAQTLARRAPSRRHTSRPANEQVVVEPVDSEDDFTPPRRSSPAASQTPTVCPLCYSPISGSTRTPRQRVLPPVDLPASTSGPAKSEEDRVLRRVPSYFELLSEANSLANTPTSTGRARSISGADPVPAASAEPPLNHSQFNDGYFVKFFEEVVLLGKGGQGTVYLVRHLLNGEALGLYACKKIPVGDSTLSLLRILREVHLLEAVQHPNIISYHHAWLENSATAAFAPPVPTLFVLMAFANGGSLSDFVAARGGSNQRGDSELDPEERKKRFRSRKNGQPSSARAVHLLRIDDILRLFKDITLGLSFLHSRNILHLDLKAENVLLHWEEEALIPTCKLSDFGNATDDSFHRERQGGSGTLEYTSPEAFKRDSKTGKLPAPDRSTDMWSLGLILHFLCFFSLPYRNTHDTVLLEDEIRSYRGFSPSDVEYLNHGSRRDIPRSLLNLMAKLVHVQPAERPNCDRVLKLLTEIAKEVEVGESGNLTSETDLVRTVDSQDDPAVSAALVRFSPLEVLASQLALLPPSNETWRVYTHIVLLETVLDVSFADLRLTVVLFLAHCTFFASYYLLYGAP